MNMRATNLSALRFILALLALAAASCSRESPTQDLNKGGPIQIPLDVRATTIVLQSAGAAPSLEVRAVVVNVSSSALFVANSAQCPLYVVLWRTAITTGAGIPNCEPGGWVEVAPRDSVVLATVIGADSLATYMPGTYVPAVTILTATDATLNSTMLWTEPVAAITLPFASSR
jgi:hypothetical protein